MKVEIYSFNGRPVVETGVGTHGSLVVANQDGSEPSVASSPGGSPMVWFTPGCLMASGYLSGGEPRVEVFRLSAPRLGESEATLVYSRTARGETFYPASRPEEAVVVKEVGAKALNLL